MTGIEYCSLIYLNDSFLSLENVGLVSLVNHTSKYKCLNFSFQMERLVHLDAILHKGTKKCAAAVSVNLVKADRGIVQLDKSLNVIFFLAVMTYMPQDFRGSLIRQQRERSERNKQAEVEALVNSGGTIRDRYALLWKQQMER